MEPHVAGNQEEASDIRRRLYNYRLRHMKWELINKLTVLRLAMKGETPLAG